MRRGETSWENPWEPYKWAKFLIYLQNTPTQTQKMFIADASTIFVLAFSALLFICWFILILWVQSTVLQQNATNTFDDDVELAIRGRSPPSSIPSSNILPSLPSQLPPAYVSRSHPRSWGNLFIDRPLRHCDDRIPSRPLPSSQFYVTPFPGEEVRSWIGWFRP